MWQRLGMALVAKKAVAFLCMWPTCVNSMTNGSPPSMDALQECATAANCKRELSWIGHTHMGVDSGQRSGLSHLKTYVWG
ncbi:hypothetical protein CDAR_492661 [Caerostris darwini]|uniref:Secreted protein n=1 Tax=Caerostris darwini TaxID=1538125 RepID=A0AAV4UZ25_9ARAC|nr:hypothetical protein CDAR_492661 [Caerostris darwini]